MLYCIIKFRPCLFKTFQKLCTLRGQRIVFSWWSLSGLNPLIRKQFIIFQACTQRIQCSLPERRLTSFPSAAVILSSVSRMRFLEVKYVTKKAAPLITIVTIRKESMAIMINRFLSFSISRSFILHLRRPGSGSCPPAPR